MISLTLNTDDSIQLSMLEHLKKQQIKIVDVVCGNLYILLQEELVFNCHNILKNYVNDFIDEYWILEMYSYMQSYMQFLTKKPVKVLSYVWDVDIIDTYVSKMPDEFNTLTLNSDQNNDLINIIVYEPNMSIHKNSLIPLLIADEYNRKYKNVNKVYMFNGSQVKNLNEKFLKHLDIVKEFKLEIYNRIIMPETLYLIHKNNAHKCIILSHTHLNNLNFLHLELFYMGYPIVHNCEPFKENGLYYSDFDLDKAINCIDNARYHYHRDIKNNTKNILNFFSPRNHTRMEDWIMNIKEILNLGDDYYDFFLKNKVVTLDEKKNDNKDNTNMYIVNNEKKMFYRGNGVILIYDIDNNEENDHIKDVIGRFKFSKIIINNNKEKLTSGLDENIKKCKYKSGILIYTSMIKKYYSIILSNMKTKNEFKYIDVFENVPYKHFYNSYKTCN